MVSNGAGSKIASAEGAFVSAEKWQAKDAPMVAGTAKCKMSPAHIVGVIRGRFFDLPGDRRFPNSTCVPVKDG